MVSKKKEEMVKILMNEGDDKNEDGKENDDMTKVELQPAMK